MSFHYHELGVQVFHMMPTCPGASCGGPASVTPPMDPMLPKPPQPPKPPKPRGLCAVSSETELDPELLQLREQLRQHLAEG